MDQRRTQIITHRTRRRRIVGIGLLIVAIGGAGIASHAIALSAMRLWCAVLLVQALALAAVTGVALLAVPPRSLARRATPEA